MTIPDHGFDNLEPFSRGSVHVKMAGVYLMMPHPCDALGAVRAIDTTTKEWVNQRILELD